MDYKENYDKWLTSDYFDLDTKEELKKISADDQEIKERFVKELEFGTGGIRGIIGAGTNRMNIYTVRKATQGFANYILKQEPVAKSMGIVIAYDSRHMSPEFARETALVFNGNGIKSYVFDELRPTPVLSFAIRHLGCIGGVVVTASHNPPEYNGYKAYWSDGGQIPYPRDEEIIQEVNSITDYSTIKVADIEEAKASGLFNIVGKEIDDEYVKNVKLQSMNPELIKKTADSLTIVYTPIHGSGNKPVRRVLQEIGFNNVHIVKEQELPDANFTTVGYPNPEDPKAFTLAIELAKKVSADVIVGTDPDCDRVGAVVKDSNGEYVVLSGNMTGVLITEYILSQKKQNGTLAKSNTIISTIVSTDMAKEIAKAYDVTYFDVLTGFKYIGEKIKEFEKTNSNEFLFGFEESYGCLAGTYARDKDAVVATMLICELAAYYKSRNMSLYEGLQEIYKKYGFYKEKIESITLKGVDGLEQMKVIMEGLRNNPPKIINNLHVTEIRDYKTSICKDVANAKEVKIDLPVSDVLYYVLEDNSWFCIRPSGTEPKIKIYFGVKGKDADDAEQKINGIIKAAMEVVAS